MSIRGEIQDRVRRGMLYPLLPKARRTSLRRMMFLSESLWKVLNSAEGDEEWEQRVANLQAELERFVDGPTIDPRYLFLLSPAADCVWEIRCTQHQPSIRVFGLFAERDVFVATGLAFREHLEGWESRQWREAKRGARAAWRTLFNTYLPMADTNIERLVSGALNGKYFR